ncbi:hypothetical protein ACVWXU_001901 [Streptomyces sp. TE33382]
MRDNAEHRRLDGQGTATREEEGVACVKGVGHQDLRPLQYPGPHPPVIKTATGQDVTEEQRQRAMP